MRHIKDILKDIRLIRGDDEMFRKFEYLQHLEFLHRDKMYAILPDPPKATKTQEVLKPNDKDVWVKISEEERK